MGVADNDAAQQQQFLDQRFKTFDFGQGAARKSPIPDLSRSCYARPHFGGRL
jgi:hypothetical protein